MTEVTRVLACGCVVTQGHDNYTGSEVVVDWLCCLDHEGSSSGSMLHKFHEYEGIKMEPWKDGRRGRYRMF